MKKLLNIILQIGLLFAFSIIGNGISSYLHLPISGSIIGIFLVLLCLKCKMIKLKWIEDGANWLLAILLLFFIPSAVGIIQYKDVIQSSGMRLFVVISLSTICVMASTGWIAELIRKRKGKAL